MEKNFLTVFTLSTIIISFNILHYHLYFHSSQYYGFKIYCVCFLPSITILILILFDEVPKNILIAKLARSNKQLSLLLGDHWYVEEKTN